MKKNSESKSILSKDQSLRRLDSLARILEGTDMCIAVHNMEKSKELVIAGNNIHANTGDKNKQMKFINDVMTYLFEIKEDISKPQDYRIKIFQEISLNQIKGEKGEVKLSDEMINNIASEFISNNRYVQNWKYKLTPKALVELALGKDNITNEEISNNISYVAAAHKFIDRLKQDFLKVEELFSNKKVAQYIVPDNYKIIKFDLPGVHAEMRIIGYLLHENDYKSIDIGYIGLSKLGCGDCDNVISAYNQAINQENGIYHDNSEDSLKEQEIIQETLALIRTRGMHGIYFEKWQEPLFLDTETLIDAFSDSPDINLSNKKKEDNYFSFLRAIQSKYQQFEKSIVAKKKENKQKGITTMIADRSPSDGKHSSELLDSKSLEENKSVPLTEVTLKQLVDALAEKGINEEVIQQIKKDPTYQSEQQDRNLLLDEGLVSSEEEYIRKQVIEKRNKQAQRQEDKKRHRP